HGARLAERRRSSRSGRAVRESQGEVLFGHVVGRSDAHQRSLRVAREAFSPRPHEQEAPVTDGAFRPEGDRVWLEQRGRFHRGEIEPFDDGHGSPSYGLPAGGPVTIRGTEVRILEASRPRRPACRPSRSRSGTTNVRGSRVPRCPGPTTRASRPSMRNANGSGGGTGSASDGPRSSRRRATTSSVTLRESRS